MNGHPLVRWISLLSLFSILLASVALPARAPTALAAHSANPTSVTIAGSLQSELGCPGDWQPDCAATHLAYDASDDVWQGTWDVPAGSWEYKAALNDSWTENYGKNAQPNGANIPLTTAATGSVKFYYDHKSHWVTDKVGSVIATVPGSFQSELGCPGDWQPDCLRSWLQDPDGDGTYAFETTGLPQGDYEAKVAINESWDENYGQGGVSNGPNILFSVKATGDKVSFSYNPVSHVLTIASGDISDAELVRPVLQNPIQNEFFYFVMPDRFSNADATNDKGGSASSDPLVHGLLPTDKGYYHGGDVKGLQAKLVYLQGLGVSAIWMTPMFKNRPVQGDGTIGGSSAAYHGYWITDFTQIDPHFGTNAELKDLISAAQQRGMKVFFDIITNHTADVISYEGNQFGYRNKTNFPYKDASGNVFDDRDYAGTATFPPLDPSVSFPYKPVFLNPADETVKVPAWLNNRNYYHNRGNSSFSGENSLYGDFFGLDDLFTEHPDVVNGMIDIHKFWIKEFQIDGFRIDTVKHVNLEFWQKFGPEILAYAAANGKPNFFMYGEVFDSNPAFMSQYTTAGKLPATLDFGFQSAAQGFAASSNATNGLRDFFAGDDYYTDADSNAYSLPTFLGNHDMGRIGRFIQTNPNNVGDAEWLARSRLAHALMFFSRGMPVVYYGDEQGFTGDGGDKDARQDMFPSQVDSYNDDDLIGTTRTTADDNFDPTHPLYTSFKEYDALRDAHLALRRGLQIHRYSADTAGIYAFSRVDRDEQVEYIVALNNAETQQSATFKTYLANTSYTAVYPAGGAPLTTSSASDITVTVPALGFVVYKASTALPASQAAPSIAISTPAAGANVKGRVEVGANLGSNQLAEVTFAVKVGNGDYRVLGTDGNAPYRVFYDVSGLENGTTLAFKAIVSDLNGHLNSATVNAVVQNETGGGGACTVPTYAVIHYNRPAGDYDGWGLHLWGDAIDDSEATEWTSPKLPNGQDAYGVFWFIKLKDGSLPVNYIIHKGDDKDTPNDRSFEPSKTPQIWVKQGDAANYTSAADATRTMTFRYKRPAGDYAGWGLHLWGDAIDPSEATEWANPKPFTVGTDGWGYATVKLVDPSLPVNFIIHKGDDKDTPDDRNVVPASLPTGINWVVQGDARNHLTQGSATNTAVIHYHRFAGDYGDYTSSNFNDFWGMHVWTGAQTPTEWQTPLKPVAADRFGQVFEVPLVAGAATLNYILHRGDTKDLPDDQELDLGRWGYEVWIIQSTTEYLLPKEPCQSGPRNSGDLSKAKAHWISRDTIAVKIDGGAANTYTLYYDPTGAITLDATRKITGGQTIPLRFDPAGLSAAQKQQWPHLADYSALKLDAADLAKVPEILKGEIAVAAVDKAGNQVEATAVQIPGVLDDLYSYTGALGLIYNGNTPTLKVWAPTARSVKLHLFNNSNPATTSTVSPMDGDPATGVWSITGTPAWTNKYFLYEVEVYAPTTGKVENNLVTDPYSVGLSINSKRSQIVNLNDAALKPRGWELSAKPELAAPEDTVLYELHVRDFSIFDKSVPEPVRGTFAAFSYDNSNGMGHLRDLAKAGLTHVHILPAFDCASIEENKALRKEPDAAKLATYPPDSGEQAAAVEAVADQDGFNWCYDPYHYNAPEGSYSTKPDGSQRIREFRDMVQALNLTRLRVVMDVVYNHTAQAGQGEKSVLDKVVPGYYHRLNAEGKVETSTCCQNTATEHAMMEKLMIDSVLLWATQYKVDGFRFDLMGHHMKANMLKLRAALDSLTLAKDGVDGKAIILYGEGWNFGEVGNNQRGVNATQLNLPGTGIATFSDRLRDAVRGGGPFDNGEDKKIQGFINGLYYDPNEHERERSGPEAQKQRLLLYQDQIKVGLAGNLADFPIIDRTGAKVKGSQVDYNGSPAGYTKDPQEVVTYIEAHDNETLFDKIQYAAPLEASVQDRMRMQNMGISIVMLSQGMPFFQAGQELLRSKSLDRNSYNSGDWFNRLDWTYTSNNWGVGLPPGENKGNWPVMQPLLANPALKLGPSEIVGAAEHFAEMLRIRRSSELFRLRTAQDVIKRVSFLNNGPNQQPGLIVMCIDDTKGADLDKNLRKICVVFNASKVRQDFSDPSLKGQSYNLHPFQQASGDLVVRQASFDRATGTFSVPPRTTAVFVLR
jgi:pullulanase-type alpha-1,6-glucosidase